VSEDFGQRDEIAEAALDGARAPLHPDGAATRRRARLAAIFVVALVVRLGFLLAYGIDAPMADWGDDTHYDQIARSLVFDGIYQDLWFPPGYSLLLSAIYFFFGPSLIAVRIVQAVLGATTCCVTYLLGRRLFDDRVGWVAAVLLAGYPSHIYMSWRIMAETLFILLVLLGVYVASNLPDRPRRRDAVRLGLALGFMTIVKSNLVVFPPALLAWLAFRSRTNARAFRRILLAAAVFLALSSATLVSNLIASSGEIGVLAANAGHTLWWSNNPYSDGYFYAPEEQEEAPIIEHFGMTDAFSEAGRLERDRLYRTLAIRWALENPITIVKLAARKLANAFGPFPHAAVLSGNPLASWTYALTWLLMLPFALMGLRASLKQCARCRPAHLLIASYVAMVLIYYGTPRFTVTISPVILVLVARGAVGAWEAMTRTRPPSTV
jgi:4-amino-4-deoxy-L-arabinose transferase-like glycosyltransferase